MFLKLIFLIALAIERGAAAPWNEPCLTAVNETAICIKLSDCYVLNQYITEKPNQLTRIQRDYLTRSQCGYDEKNKYICCSEKYRYPPEFAERIHLENTTRNTQEIVPRESKTIKMNRSLVPRPPDCGAVDIGVTNRISGGTETKIDSYPWVALLSYGTNLRNRCGGALINERYVLTAAHCVVNLPNALQLKTVRLGEWDLGTDEDCAENSDNIFVCLPRYIDIPVAEVIAHPDYVTFTRNNHNDIALVRLAESVTYRDSIRPICLPTDEKLRDSQFQNVKMNVVGWGITETGQYSDKKLKATLTIKNLTACTRKYGREGIILSDKHICAGGEMSIDTCAGDSGGPLMYKHSENGLDFYYLTGIISFGPSPCGQQGFPSVNTRVGAYIDWIQYTIRT